VVRRGSNQRYPMLSPWRPRRHSRRSPSPRPSPSRRLRLCHSKSPRCSHSHELTMSGRTNGIARHPSPCYIGRASAGHCSKPVNNPAGRISSDFKPTSGRPPTGSCCHIGRKNFHFETVFVRSMAGVRSVACNRALLPLRRARGHHKNPPSSTDAGHWPGYVTRPYPK